MGDTICSGLAYILTCCCCCSGTDPGTDGSGFCSGLGKKKYDRDPREKALKQEFMGRGYSKDGEGHIRVEQPSKSQLMTAAMGQQPRGSGNVVGTPEQLDEMAHPVAPPGIASEEPP
ncbi:hypothetical protein C8R46DRAFT_1218835 [Mycena filopes]|nr:hypothetical protein C8R46DRAFT_1218835 [Mycena filopes]